MARCLALGLFVIALIAFGGAPATAQTAAELAELEADANPGPGASAPPQLGGISCPVGTELTTFYLTDFESGDAGWVESGFGEWERGAPVLGVFEGCDTSPRPEPAGANSGTSVFATNLNGCYANSNSDSILSQTFDFSSLAAPIELRWFHWYEVFETFDFAIARVNGTQVWRTPNATATPSYVEQAVDLSAYAGNPAVLVEYLLHATTVVNRTGWYLDDIEIRYCAAPVGCTLTCPGQQSASAAAGTCAATVNYPAPTEEGGACGTVTCVPPSGSSFAVGTTPVSCTSSVGGGSCGFDVVVTDDEAPVLAACPANIFEEVPPEATDAIVVFAAPTYTDNCAAPGVATCVPPTGSTFPLGTTGVNCSVTDGDGNSASCGFDVTVAVGGGGPSVLEIPTATTIGLAGLALLLAGAGFVALRRGA